MRGPRSRAGYSAGGDGHFRSPPADLWRARHPHASHDGSIRPPVDVLDLRLPALCALLAEQGDFEFETAKVDGAAGGTVRTDRGNSRADLIVDALGWRRVLGRGEPIQPPDAYLSRGLEVHPHGTGDDLEIWIDRRYVPAGYGWSFPADHEVRVGVGSFDPRFHVKEPTVQLAAELHREPSGYQGNWIPHRIREATESGIFFVGDRRGTACRSRPRASVRRSTSESPAAANSGPSSMVARRRSPRSPATAPSVRCTAGNSSRCSAFSNWSPAFRRGCSRPTFTRSGPSAWSTGLLTTTSRSRHPASPAGQRRPSSRQGTGLTRTRRRAKPNCRRCR